MLALFNWELKHRWVPASNNSCKLISTLILYFFFLSDWWKSVLVLIVHQLARWPYLSIYIQLQVLRPGCLIWGCCMVRGREICSVLLRIIGLGQVRGVDLLGYTKNNWLVFKIYHRDETSCTPKSPIFKRPWKLNNLIEEVMMQTKYCYGLQQPTRILQLTTLPFFIHDMSTFLVGFQPMLFRYIKFLYILGSFMNLYGSRGSKKQRKKDLKILFLQTIFTWKIL
jgi:hypothetical protein